MSDECEAAIPEPVEFCGGRLVGEPVLQPIRFYNGTAEEFFIGRRWLLDGEHVHPDAAREFHRAWLETQNSSDGSGIVSAIADTGSSGETNSSSAPSGG